MFPRAMSCLKPRINFVTLRKRQEQWLNNKESCMILFLSKKVRAECFGMHLNSGLKRAVFFKQETSVLHEFHTFKIIKLL